MSANIANTIWKQITASGMIKVWSWGVPLNSRVGQDEKDGSGWLRFKVKGMKFKGYVKVIYNRAPDLYTVQFIKEKKKKNSYGRFDSEFITEKEIEGIYCDQLIEVIDEYVEKIPAYKH